MADQTTLGQDTIEFRADIYKDNGTLFRYWMNCIEIAGENDKDWRKDADEAVDIYTNKIKVPFNILASNTDTMRPAAFNSNPVPDIRSRFGDRNEPARLGAQIIERTLSYQLDEYDFEAMAKAAVQDAVLAGRGVARVRYKTFIVNDEQTGERVAWEQAICERVPFKHFRRGPGNSWPEIPFIAYEQFLNRDELVRICEPQPEAGKEPLDPEALKEAALQMAKEVPLDCSDSYMEGKSGATTREKSAFQKARVWEIWDKETRQVIFLAPGYEKSVLRIEKDPYGFLEFFDCPAPMQPRVDPDSFKPLCPYSLYREQAEELNEMTLRLKALVKVLKFRGIRASEIIELDSLEDLEDGKFVASQGALAAIGGGKSLDDAIWVMPIDKLITVIKELVIQRNEVKQIIYEITGIADILRGSTDPSETLGAQQIKAQWGSLRMQEIQKDVQRWCRDIFRLKGEIVGNKFRPETLTAIQGEEIPPEVLDVLRSDVRRCYMIDIETDSTIRGDQARAQQNMTGFMAATGQFIQTFVPLIDSGKFPPELAAAAVTVFGAFARNFKLGKTVDDTLSKLEQSADRMVKEQIAKKPEREAKQQEQEQIQKAGVQLALKREVAEIGKIEAETQEKDVNAQKSAAEIMQKSDDNRQRQADRTIEVAEAMVGAEKTKSDIQKTEAETIAQNVETALVVKTGGKAQPDGFIQ